MYTCIDITIDFYRYVFLLKLTTCAILKTIYIYHHLSWETYIHVYFIYFFHSLHTSVMKSSTVCIVKYWYMHNVLGSSFSSFPYTGYSSLWRTVTKYTVTIKWKILNSHWIICHINVLVLNDMVSVCESSEVDQVKPIEKEVCHTNTWWTDNSFITFI